MNVLSFGAIWATLICAGAGAMMAMGFGTPNLSDGTSLIGWWTTLWTASFITVPLGALMIGAAAFVYDRILSPIIQRI
jgi:hypothetical protein